jgi:hypothetical protein
VPGKTEGGSWGGRCGGLALAFRSINVEVGRESAVGAAPLGEYVLHLTIVYPAMVLVGNAHAGRGTVPTITCTCSPSRECTGWHHDVTETPDKATAASGACVPEYGHGEGISLEFQ